jgi:hypothetical protein
MNILESPQIIFNMFKNYGTEVWIDMAILSVLFFILVSIPRKLPSENPKQTNDCKNPEANKAEQVSVKTYFIHYIFQARNNIRHWFKSNVFGKFQSKSKIQLSKIPSNVVNRPIQKTLNKISSDCSHDPTISHENIDNNQK